MHDLALERHVPGVARCAVRTIADRRMVWCEIDPTDRRGALSFEASGVLAHAARTATRTGVPLVTVLGSSGADIVEGIAALHGWGDAARALARASGTVPTVFIVDGPAVSGPALLLGLADIVIMTRDSYAFVSGPTMVAEFTGVDISAEELGGAPIHLRATGAAAMIARDRTDAIEMALDVLGHLPDNADTLTERSPCSDPADRPTPEAGHVVPAHTTGSYDVRDVIAAVVDDTNHLELRAGWASNIVTTLARIDGHAVGIVANQPITMAGTLDIPASQKAARFVAFCDAFNVPIVTFVDTPGFYPGKDLEWRGMIRHGAQLVAAYARATVPRVCVILRKSYGGAYIVMDSKEMGNDLCVAWPTAELAVMGAGQAAAILQRRATPEERGAFEADYTERLLNPYVAAERGIIDAVIEPGETRRVLARALEALADKRETMVGRKHDNGPL
jgi:acetyl-CoA carboxylase carboxyltransferase component